MTNWLNEIDRFEEDLRLLAGRMRGLTNQMEQDLCPPSEDMIDAMLEVLKRFKTLAEQLARELNNNVPGFTTDVVHNAHDLRELVRKGVQARRQSLEKPLREAQKLVSTIVALNHRESPTFAPLRECQDRARQLQERITWALEHSTDDATLDMIRSELPPFVAVLRIVERIEELSDDELDDLEDRVTDFWSRALARAAIRRRLVIGPGSNDQVLSMSQHGQGPEMASSNTEAPRIMATPLPPAAAPTDTDTDLRSQRLEHNDPKPPSTERKDLPMTASRRKLKRASTTALLGGIEPGIRKDALEAGNEPRSALRTTTSPPPPPSILQRPVPLEQLLDGFLSPPPPAACRVGPADGTSTDSDVVQVASPNTGVACITPSARTDSALPTATAQVMTAAVEAHESQYVHPVELISPTPAPVVDTRHAALVEAEAQLTTLAPDVAPLATFPAPQVVSLEALPQEPVELARLARGDLREHPRQVLVRLVRELLRLGRVGIAYHLARCLEARQEGSLEAIPPSALRALALGPLINSSFGELVDDVGECIRDLHDYAIRLSNVSGTTRLAGDLVLFSLSLRPALFAPSTGAAALLEQLDLQGQLAGLSSLLNAILAFSHLNLELTPSILKGVREHAAWESQVQSHREKCQLWRERSRLAQLVYVPATHVWRSWFEPGGNLAALFDIIGEDRRDRAGEVRRAVESWSSPQHVDHMVNKVDREIRPDARTKPIEARARVKLQERVKEAMSLLRDWLNLLARDPHPGSDPTYVRANECRLAVRSHIGEAEKVMETLLAGPTAASLSIAGQVALDTLRDLKRLFDPTTEAPSMSPLPRQALCDELLTITTLSLDHEWSIPSTDYASPELLNALLQHLERGPVDWCKAFDEQSARGNHEATDRILERLARRPVAGMDVGELRRAQQKDIGERCAKLKLSIGTTTTLIERAIAEDLFPESEVLEFRSIIENSNNSEVRNFASAEGRLEEVRQKVDVRRRERIDEVRARLRSHPFSVDLDAVERALEKGDLLAANEYIAMLERGEPIRPIEQVRDVFARFFPEGVQAVQNLLDRQGQSKRELIRAVGRRESQGPLDMSGVSDEQAEESKKMLLAWMEAFGFEGSDAGGRLQQVLVDVLQALGFRNVRLTPSDGQASDRVRSYNMQTEQIREQQTCVIPQYGSLAAGRYRLLCAWKRPSEEEVVELVGSAHHHDRQIILLYFGRMSDVRRRSLALLSRQRRRTFILIDENLIFFLAMEESQRLHAFFSCTFPFTVIDPYTTTAGLVPQEMFFGRSREKQSVFEPTGTNLVYGGRQLGKTALLRDVERRHSAPAKGIIVKWIDLKAEGIGMNRPIRDLWVVIATILSQEKVLTRSDYSPDTLGTKVAEWLDRDASRRVVLLLDESDAFLKSDAETPEGPNREVFSNLWRLKGIMDKTGRRFKVVFAGLHNVQRTSRDVNSPLAHLGTPICIGPLLENSEWQEARRLVTMPFSQLGYRFESEDLPTRILAHANWYPSLIQLFCKHLLEHLTHPNRPSFSIHSCPPYTITSQHIEEAYQSQELRKAIVDRFRWTLDLDPRYRIIALVIAHESATRRAGLVNGFPVQWIREQALDWWESGFKGTTTLEGFRTILDEMIGLGLLRKVNIANYALRSPNVVNLLGTKKEIEQAILDAAQHQPPPEYEASTFRRAVPHLQISGRSPLTALQESQFFTPTNGISLLFGSEPAGLVDTIASLRAASSAQNIEIEDEWAGVKSAQEFRAILDDRFERRGERISVFVVPDACPWTVDWVAEAASKVAQLKSPKKIVRIAFLADPLKAWLWVQRDAGKREKLESAGIKEVSLAPWHDTAVRRWLIDVELGPSGGNGAELFTRVTGNWGMLLHEVARRCDKGRHQWERHLQEFEQELVSTRSWLDHFELPPVPLAVLKVLSDMDDVLSLDDLCDLTPDVDRERVAQAMAWAELLGYAMLVGTQQWRLDRLLSRLLAQCPA
ncbi:hypothetical protein [Chondromyces apiculatus]|uniref:Uncharacterized protein n=1 Tax=Chondromyces apiculatus DSM 436 TaxID=1192034 RepID=A0A017TIF6_9BACT|nr:hypothetical protein [Chondromyces apiculatus]EYF08677.1 Hypothetical protein CAP_2538 [Chondromyces apiculatus DSM 436]